MLEEIVEDNFVSVAAESQPIFRTDVDYDALVARRDEIVAAWRVLGKEDRAKYTNQAAFEKQEGASDLKQDDLIPARNLSLITREIRERMNAHNTLQILPLETLDFDDSLLELAESLENVTEIRDLYRLRKRTTGVTKNAGINEDEAGRIKNCFSQGRELYVAGKQGSLMVNH